MRHILGEWGIQSRKTKPDQSDQRNDRTGTVEESADKGLEPEHPYPTAGADSGKAAQITLKIGKARNGLNILCAVTTEVARGTFMAF